MTCKAVLFDMDGTLLDTLEDIAAAANRALAAWNYPTHPLSAYRRFVGDGSAVLMARAMPDPDPDPRQVQALLEAFLEAYGKCWNVATRPYPGIPELLNDLVGMDIGLGIVSNKPHPFTRTCADAFFGKWPFGPVLGHQAGIRRKPAPDGALEAAGALGVRPETCWFLGDSPMDMECAVRAGMTPVGAAWGFRPVDELMDSGAKWIIQAPRDLLGIPGFGAG
ncbi:MAG: HAD family hydrolase [Desulfobacterales bacterium]